MPTLNAAALVIGIAAYEQVARLPETVLKDATDIHELLVDAQACGYAPDAVQLLLDGAATQAALRQALADLAERSSRDTTVFFYLSSHGARIETGPHAGEYLLPVDTVANSAESIAQTAISGDEFTAALRAIPARKAVVIFDCCHAGGIGQPKGAIPPVLKALPESYYDTLRTGRGRAILASSRSTEFSYVRPGDANSLFTKHLLAGLRGGVPSEDGVIRIFDLFEYLQPRVTGEQSQQHPLFKAELEENFPVALRQGGQRHPPSRDEDGFRYDAYLSYVDRAPDAAWVWETLVPRLEMAGLRVAVSGDVEQPGVARVVGIERGIREARRTVVVLSPAYLEDAVAEFEATLAQTLGLQEGSYRVLPIRTGAIATEALPTRLSMLTILDLAHPQRAGREWERLLQALAGPLPRTTGLRPG